MYPPCEIGSRGGMHLDQYNVMNVMINNLCSLPFSISPLIVLNKRRVSVPTSAWTWLRPMDMKFGVKRFSGGSDMKTIYPTQANHLYIVFI